MIAVVPKLYADELIYSWCARYHIYSGHMCYQATADALFAAGDAIPSPEFLVKLTQEAYGILTEKRPFSEIVEKHTMLPYYIRFLPLQRRQRAYSLLMDMDRTFYDSLYMRKNKTARRQNMRYCPLCAARDRENYGETYWHRSHQLTGIDICVQHRCRLEETKVGIATDCHRNKIFSAEEAVPQELSVDESVSDLEMEISTYVLRVFEAGIDFENDISAGKFLQSHLEGTPYTSLRGEQVFARKLYDSLQQRYRELPQFTLEAWWYVQKIFCAQNFHTYDICLIAYFLKIPVGELLQMTLPEMTLQQRFDSRLRSLRESGMTQKQAAEAMGVSIHAVKSVEEKRIKRDCGLT